MKMEPSRRTHLFTLRIWQEEVGAAHREWRARIQYLPDGEVRLVRGLPNVAEALRELLSAGEGHEATPPDRC